MAQDKWEQKGIYQNKYKECISMIDKKDILDDGPFFHGTKAELKIGDLLEPQHVSNYQDKKSNHIYFTATLDAAKWGG